MRVREWKTEIVFLHEVAPGAADRSYGIHVAQLAGLPAAVVARAEEVLAALEKGEQSGAVTRLADDLPLFAAGAGPSRRRRRRSRRSRRSSRRWPRSIPTSSRRREALELLYALRRAAYTRKARGQRFGLPARPREEDARDAVRQDVEGEIMSIRMART